ncbi:MAG TPA: hypothetical protein VH592_26640 [Gemmataceae bacterium]|jgi:hypothetical protein
MDLDPLEIITEGCWLAVRFGLHISAVPTGNLSGRRGAGEQPDPSVGD